jgi:hypothetical protein
MISSFARHAADQEGEQFFLLRGGEDRFIGLAQDNPSFSIKMLEF